MCAFFFNNVCVYTVHIVHITYTAPSVRIIFVRVPPANRVLGQKKGWTPTEVIRA